MIRVGIIGLGKMGQAHADWIINNPGMSFEAICEKNAERGQALKEKYQVKVYSDVDEFLRSAPIDLVVIVTTNEVHELLTVKALDAGKDVVVEKPMTITYESALRMAATAKRNNRKLMVHHSSRWDRDYYLVRDIISSGKIGNLLSIQSKVMLCDAFWASWGIDGMANPWRIKAEYGGGMLYDWGPHLVDQCIQLMGTTPKKVYGKLQTSGVWGSEVDDAFFAMLDFGNNVFCQIECSNNAKLDLPRWYITGTKGALLVEGKHEPFWDQAVLTYLDAYNNQRTEKITLGGIHESGLEGGFYEEIVPYLNGETDRFIAVEEACNVIKVLELIAKSSASGDCLNW